MIPEIAPVKHVLPKKMDKPTSAQDFFATRRYNDNSPEQHTKEEGIAQWIGRTGLPARIVEDEEFIAMMAKMDKNACYFNPEDNKAEHKLLNLKEMVHPLTAELISTLLEESMEEWGIPREKVLTTITDNGSNMVASFHTHAEVSRTSEEDSEAEHDDDNEHQEDEDDRYSYGAIERTPCVVHTVQLVVNMVQKKPPI
ncbi:hypothetical protein DPEC_G00044000 [Dallia pectoralis]|uniref:Uncharacterized protein n=1 Tax=Dallia pectoralis TaxID=75939 RepID=A0ACC2H9Y9_DALPE|nr:hypothetical protein DPEC_G00044000 [Dallia pectoralis]